jgi:hypothetical protein
MRRVAKLISLLALACFATAAFADKPTASAILRDAEGKARAGKQNVLVLFDASW